MYINNKNIQFKFVTKKIILKKFNELYRRS